MGQKHQDRCAEEPQLICVMRYRCGAVHGCSSSSNSSSASDFQASIHPAAAAAAAAAAASGTNVASVRAGAAASHRSVRPGPAVYARLSAEVLRSGDDVTNRCPSGTATPVVVPRLHAAAANRSRSPIIVQRRLERRFDFNSTAIRLQFDRATTIRRPALSPGCCTAV